jgi:NADPH:quinone reductase-like Zn-dependent oxidoreductase
VTPIPPTMRAAVSRRYGKPEVVHIEEIPTPSPGAGEMLVRVRATTLNRTDCGYRGGKPFLIRFFGGIRRPRSPVWGTEFAGDVVALGEGATRFAVGDRVAGWCDGTFGAHAEYVTVKENRLIVPIPDGRSYLEAAPSTEGSLYAMGMLRMAHVGPGSDVMVYGATGAIGSAAVQMAKDLGARVTAVGPTAHMDMVRSLGPDRVIDYQTEDFTRDTQRYDLVLDAVGKSSFRKTRRLLKKKGIFTATDARAAHIPFLGTPIIVAWMLIALLFRLSPGRKLVLALPRKDPEGIKYLKDFIASGRFRPVLDRTYPLDQIVEAYRFVETGQKVGNVVIQVG